MSPKHTVHYLKRDKPEKIRADRPDEDDYEYAAYDQEFFCGDKSIEKGLWDEPGGPPEISAVDAGYEKNIWCPHCKHIEDFKQVIDERDPEDFSVHKRLIYRNDVRNNAWFWCPEKQAYVSNSDVPRQLREEIGQCRGCQQSVCWTNSDISEEETARIGDKAWNGIPGK